MAARENQGYLIAVIILVLVSLILALAAFLGISKASEYADNRDALSRDLALQKNLVQAFQEQTEIMKAYIGDLGPSVAVVQTQIDSLAKLADPSFDQSQKDLVTDVIDNVKKIQEEYTEDMKMFVATGDGDQPLESTWRSLAKNLAFVVNKKHNDLNVERNERLRITREAQSESETAQKTIEETNKTLEAVRNELQTEKTRHAEDKRKMTTAMENIKKANNANIDEIDKNKEDFKIEKENYVGLIKNITEEKDSLKEKVDRYEREVFDLPDGKIVRAANNVVHINLGTLDGLRRNRSFAVYDQSETNFVDGKHKATIEVTDVTGAHQAVARIKQEDPKRPILKDDYILTATWDPGYAVPIALVGVFDLDHDGTSDLQQLVRMIEKNGGRVVAQHDMEGNITGKIDSSTRYVVLGNEPKLSGDSNLAILDSIATLLKQSKANSVQEIDTRKLLNWMGVHGQAKIERFDSRMGDEFRRRDPISGLKSRDR